VPSIYREVLGIQLDWTRYEIPVFSADEQITLTTICDKHGVSSEMMAKLVELERSLQGMSRRASVQRKLTAVLEEDWRTADELFPTASEEVATCS
jgi:DNA sulfur modification protein DndC